MYDYVVIGGGIVGVATAMTLVARHQGISLLLLEKENALALHQTGRNSGVLHAGVYYAPGSLKAQLCRAGRSETIAFCERHNVRCRVTGKLLVATGPVELTRARALSQRCDANGITHRWLDREELAQLEPYVQGEGAILVPDTGIVDYVGLTVAMANVIRAAGGEIRCGEEALALREGPASVEIETTRGLYRARRLIACAGLQSDRLARLMGLGRDIRIIPFRGEYFRLRPEWNERFSHLIYPIPDPELPFLGVHVTKMIDGSVTVGPNAVLGFAREGYGKFSVRAADLRDMLAFRGFWRVMAAHAKSGIREFANSASRRRYLSLCRRYCPALTLEDLEPHPTGIRAQAVWADGRLEHDFLVLNTARTIHVCNAPSPAATSALPIARHIAGVAEARLAA